MSEEKINKSIISVMMQRSEHIFLICDWMNFTNFSREIEELSYDILDVVLLDYQVYISRVRHSMRISFSLLLSFMRK